MVIGEISDYRHKQLHAAVRKLDWDKIKKEQQLDPTEKQHCSSFDLLKYLIDLNLKKSMTI